MSSFIGFSGTGFSGRKSFPKKIITFAVLGVALVGCAEAELGAQLAKSVAGTTAGERIDGHPDGRGGYFKVGNPYKIDGDWYYPKDDTSYDSTGIGSWYGPQFHGKKTANGEVFDQNSISAAHPTLPMPTIARVTNLENGRSLIVRVNDRGPFARGREIDLSRRSAELLGYRKQGTAKVRVQYLGRAPLYGEKMPARFAESSPKESFVMPKAKQRDDDTLAPAIPSAPVQVATLGAAMAPIANSPAVTGQVEQSAVPTISDLFVQAGAFSSQGNAELVRQQLAPLGDATVTPIDVNGQTLYRVRVGPVESVESADTVLNRVVQQGHKGARIIVD